MDITYGVKGPVLDAEGNQEYSDANQNTGFMSFLGNQIKNILTGDTSPKGIEAQ